MQELASNIVGLFMVRNRSLDLILFPGDKGSRQNNVFEGPLVSGHILKSAIDHNHDLYRAKLFSFCHPFDFSICSGRVTIFHLACGMGLHLPFHDIPVFKTHGRARGG